MDESAEKLESVLESKWLHLGEKQPALGSAEKVEDMLTNERFKAAGGR